MQNDLIAAAIAKHGATKPRGGPRPGAGRPNGSNPAKSSLVVLRVEPARKAAWVRSAQSPGGLSAAICRAMDAASGYQPRD